MTSPGGSFIRIIISGAARTGAAFASVRAGLRRLIADARVAARRMTNHFIARGGIAGAISRNLARASASLRRFGSAAARIGLQVAQMGIRVGAAAAPYAFLASKVLLATAAIASLLGVAGNALGIIQLVAPAAIAAGSAMAVFKMALSGVADAMKAGIEGDAEKFNEAIKKLSPTAQQAVRTLLDLRHEWVATQKAVQNRFFAGFRDDVIAVSRAVQPIADKWLPKMADAFAAARLAIRQVITQSADSGQLDGIMANVTKFFQNLIMVVQPLGKAFLDVAEVAAPKFARLGEVIANAAKAFRDWIAGAKESGKLQEWLDKAWETFKKLWEVVKNLSTAIAGIFGATSEGGDDFLDSLVKWTKDLSDWVNSGDGQEFIGFLSEIISFLGQMSPLLGYVLGFLKTMVGWWGLLAAAGAAAWNGIVEAAKFAIMWILNGYGMLVNGAAKAFGWMPGIGPKLKAAAAEFNAFRDNVNNSLNGIKKTVDVTVNYRARYIGNHLVSGAQQSGTYISGSGGRASGGNASGVIMAGERGPEMIDVGGSARVHNAGETKRMLSGGGGTGTNVNIAFGTPSPGNHLASATLEEIRTGRLPLRVTIDGKSYRVKTI